MALALSVLVGLITLLPMFADGRLLVGLGMGLVFWLVSTHLVGLRGRLRNKNGWTAFVRDLAGNGRSYYGMLLAHLGVAVFIVGATLVSNFEVEKDVRVSPGAGLEIGGHRFILDGVEQHKGPNYTAFLGQVRVFKEDELVATLAPEKRTYLVQTMPMTEAAIDPGLTRDLYVSLGEPLGNGDWSIRIYYKPFVRWIWLGAIFMALGGLLSISDRRYRIMRRRAASVADRAVTEAG
jgi:cytochrome c-type biogenesis protein CcmF